MSANLGIINGMPTPSPGASWNSPPWNTAWGKVAYVRTTNNTITSDVLVGLNLTFTAVAGRMYKFTTYISQQYQASSARVIYSLVISGWGSQRIADILLLNSNDYRNINSSYAISGIPEGTRNVTITRFVAFGAHSLTSEATVQHMNLIEDIGPA